MRRFVVTTTIPSGGSLSLPLDCGELVPTLLLVPSPWTTAAVTFQVSTDGTTWTDLRDGAGNEVAVAAGAGGAAFALSRDLFQGARYLRLRSGTAATPVAQAASRTLTVVLIGQ